MFYKIWLNGSVAMRTDLPSISFTILLGLMNGQKRKSMFFIPQCHSMCNVFFSTGRRVLGFHRCYCSIRICGCPSLWVQHSRTHSLARSNTSLDSCPRRSLSQFLSRDPWVLCLILVPWKIRCGRTCILPWPLQSTKKKKTQPRPTLAFITRTSLVHIQCM